MYTQCPECKKQHTLSVAELRSAQGGEIWCDGCSSMFDALAMLENGSIGGNKAQNDTLSRLENSTKKTNPAWHFALSLCLIILAFQIYFFEGYNLTQNTILRPWLEKTCSFINCQLPAYKNLNEIIILKGSFEPTEDGQYFFRAVILNQSEFAQNYPSIKLTLIDFTGLAYAERIFPPEKYTKTDKHLIEPDMSAEITMNIAMPSEKVGGYRFELI